MLAWAWLRGNKEKRRGVLDMLLAVLLALGVAQVVAHAWPQPHPFMIHAGFQFLPHAADPGLPSDHVTVIWSVAFAALITVRFATWSVPLFALGLLVGRSRIFLGVHFPHDVAAALPVAIAGAMLARSVRSPMAPLYAGVLRLYAWFAQGVPWRGRA